MDKLKKRPLETKDKGKNNEMDLKSKLLTMNKQNIEQNKIVVNFKTNSFLKKTVNIFTQFLLSLFHSFELIPLKAYSNKLKKKHDFIFAVKAI